MRSSSLAFHRNAHKTDDVPFASADMAFIDSASTYEEPFTFLQDMVYSFETYSLNHPSQDAYYSGFSSLPCGEANSAIRPTEITYDTDEENTYDLYYRFADWWGKDGYSKERVSHDNGYHKVVGNTEDNNPSQEKDNPNSTYHASDLIILYCGVREEEETYNYGWPEPTRSYRTVDMKLYEGIFGYWSCLVRRNHLENQGEEAS